MKQAILFSVILTVFACPDYARPADQVAVNMATGTRNCGDTSLNAIPAPQQMLREIVEVMGLASQFEVRAANVLNIEATVSRGKKYIYYNPAFVNWLNQSTHDKWAVMTLLAHEIGHHQNGHTKKKGGSRPHLELEADEYAGFVLRKLGAGLRETQEVMLFIASVKTSKTHPSRTARIKAIAKGWNKADAEATAAGAFGS